MSTSRDAAASGRGAGAAPDGGPARSGGGEGVGLGVGLGVGGEAAGTGAGREGSGRRGGAGGAGAGAGGNGGEARAEARLARALDQAALERGRTTAIAVTAGLVAIAPVVALITGLPDAFYYWGLIAVFMTSVWAQHLTGRRWPGLVWPDWAFAALNFGLMTFTLIYPNPFSDFSTYPLAPAVMLRFGNFVYFFVLLAALSFSFSPALVLWGGVCGAAWWSLGRLWVVTRPGVVVAGEPVGQGEGGIDAALRRMLSPEMVDPGVWVQEVAAFLITAGLLAAVVRGSRKLVLRQAALERRGANLARYVPASVAERMAEADEPFLEDRAPPAAVLFTDVVGFTGWAETRSPEAVMELLRGVHAFVGEEVFRAGGVLDKFIGDGAMATFGVAPGRAGGGGAPGPEEAARRALACAAAILGAAAAFNRARVAAGKDPARISVGVHFGPVLVGDVGGAGRMELSVVGDVVNVASRLEALTRALGCGAAASEEIMRAAGGAPEGWKDRGRRLLPGRHGGVTVWSLDHAADDPAGAGAAVP